MLTLIKRSMKITLCVTVLICVNIISQDAYGSSSRDMYRRAIAHVKKGNFDLAFMNLRTIIAEYPDFSRYSECLFAVGEYYYRIHAYNEALVVFNEYLEKFPETEGRVFALAYVLNLAALDNQKNLYLSVKKEIQSSEKVFLIFSKYKELEYTSILDNHYTMHYYIDTIEVHINDELFSKITP